jgi:multicomponent Na+:H+ antiporter subunit D
VIRVLTPLPVLLPLLGAAAALLAGGRHPRIQRTLSITVLSAVLAVSVLLLLLADAEGAAAVSVGGWPVPLGVVLVVDRLSALMLVVAATVALGVLVFAVGQGAADGDEETPVSIFHPTFLVLVAGVANAFLAGDLFNLYVGFEILLTASYVLLTLGGSAPRIRAGITYIVVSLLSSVLFLAAIALVYAATGTVNMAQLAVRLAELPAGTQMLLQSMLLIAFSIKAAVFPLSAWLPDSYPTAPAPVTAVFAGLLTKVGVYAIIRTQTLLFPGGALDRVLMWAALATMIIGILGAVAQTDIRRILSFTLVSHIGYMVFGIGLATAAGLAGAVFYVVHHIAIQTTLFLVAGLVERTGDSTSVDRLGGLAKASPLLAVLYFVPAMNLAGIPPFSGFIGKLGLLEAGVSAGGWLPYAVVTGGVVASLLTLVAVSRVWTRAFWRPPTQSPTTDTFGAAAAEAGPETGPVPLDGGADGGGEDGGEDGDEVGDVVSEDEEGTTTIPAPGGASRSGATTRRAARRAAWARHTAVATATTPATDGLGDEDDSGRRALRPLPRVMVGATAAMVVLTVALTGLAGPLYGVTSRAADDLLDRRPYIEAVFGEEGVP